MVSIDNRALGELVRVLDARSYAARTQLNTATFDNAMDRLSDAIDQSEAIELSGRPSNIDPPLWQQFEIALARAIQSNDTLFNQAMGFDPEDDWSTFTGEDPADRFIARTPTTSGEPDVVGARTTGSALPSTKTSSGAPTASGTTSKSDAIDAFRIANQVSSSPAAPWYTSPVVLGLGAAGLVGIFYLVKK